MTPQEELIQFRLITMSQKLETLTYIPGNPSNAPSEQVLTAALTAGLI
jgi:hypothetical protein